MKSTSERYINGEYLSHNPTWDQEDSAWKGRQVLDMLDRHGIRPKRVCEVGCGAGEVLHQLYRALPDDVTFLGLDISPQAISFCREKQSDRLRFAEAALPPEDCGKFDLMLILDVMEHVECPHNFLRELRGLAHYKLLHIPLEMSAFAVMRGRPLLEARRKVGHLHFYTRDLALATLQESGLEVLDHTFTTPALQLKPRSRGERLMRLPRRILHLVSPSLAARLLGGFPLLVLCK